MVDVIGEKYRPRTCETGRDASVLSNGGGERDVDLYLQA